MATVNRSLSDAFQEIVGNVQEIVRSEAHSAKTKVREEPARAKSSTLLFGAGAITASFATLFLLLTIVDALALAMPSWTAALIVAAALAGVASGMLAAGIGRFKKSHPPSVRTFASIKERVEWDKRHTCDTPDRSTH